MMSKKDILKQFQEIPGVGPSIAQDLYELGFRAISDLKKADPEAMYQQRCKQQGQYIDRCLLYVFRCAVYYASHTKHDARLLLWWNWKDK